MITKLKIALVATTLFFAFACTHSNVFADEHSGKRMLCVDILRNLSNAEIEAKGRWFSIKALNLFSADRAQEFLNLNIIPGGSLFSQIQFYKQTSTHEAQFLGRVRRFLTMAPLIYSKEGRPRYPVNYTAFQITNKIKNLSAFDLISRYKDSITKEWTDQIEAIASTSGFEKILEVDHSIQRQVIERQLLEAVSPIKNADRQIQKLVSEFGDRQGALRYLLNETQADGDEFSHWAERMLGTDPGLIEAKIRARSAVELSELRGKFSSFPYVADSPVHVMAAIAKAISPRPGDSLIDIGSGTGTAGNIFAVMHPDLRVRGYEFVEEKIEEANRVAENFGLKNVEYIKQDLGEPNFILPKADFYYIFNPVSGEVFDRLFEQLENLAKKNKFQVVVHYRPFDIFRSSRVFRYRGEILSTYRTEVFESIGHE